MKTCISSVAFQDTVWTCLSGMCEIAKEEQGLDLEKPAAQTRTIFEVDWQEFIYLQRP